MNLTVSATAAQITRVEVIDATGRVFSSRYANAGVLLSLQDDGRTLKVFAGEPEETNR